jgi:hypothetical protein
MSIFSSNILFQVLLSFVQLSITIKVYKI